MLRRAPPPHRRQRLHRASALARLARRRAPGDRGGPGPPSLPAGRLRRGGRAAASHRGRLPQARRATGLPRRPRRRLLPAALDGSGRRFRGKRGGDRPGLRRRPAADPLRADPLSWRTDRRIAPAVAPPSIPAPRRGTAARKRHSADGAARVDHRRLRLRLLRDRPRPGREAALDDLPALGEHPLPADRDPQRDRLPDRPARAA